MNRPLPRCTPESQGIASSAIVKFVETVNTSIQELHSFILMRHGQVVAEGWWSPYRPDLPHMLFSLSKSFTSSAIGFAVAEGRLTVDDRVTDFFPTEKPAEISDNLAAMRVRHLLSMSTGHDTDATGPMTHHESGHWVRGFLALPVEHAPGTKFVYNSAATYMLSAIIQRITGDTLIDYLTPRLFEPLGIQNPTWQSSPQGVNVGGWGLSITTEDIASFGQLYLNKGTWNGQRILPESWINEATSAQVSNGSNPESDWEQGYGYQFWRCRHNAYRGDGAFGQYCIVMPDQDAVLAITSGVQDMQVVLNVVWDTLLPAMGEPLADDASAQADLKRVLSGLALHPPQGSATSPLGAQVSGKVYTLDANEQKAETVQFDFSGAEPTVTVRNPGGLHSITGGSGVWRDGSTALFGEATTITASGVWSADDTFVWTLQFCETPFVQTWQFRFGDSRVDISGKANVGFGPTEFTLVGHLA